MPCEINRALKYIKPSFPEMRREKPGKNMEGSCLARPTLSWNHANLAQNDAQWKKKILINYTFSCDSGLVY